VDFEGEGWSARIRMENASDHEIASLLTTFKPTIDHLAARGKKRRLKRKRYRNEIQLPVKFPEAHDFSLEGRVQWVLDSVNLEDLKKVRPPELIVAQLWSLGVRNPDVIHDVMERLKKDIPHLAEVHGLERKVEDLMKLIR